MAHREIAVLTLHYGGILLMRYAVEEQTLEERISMLEAEMKEIKRQTLGQRPGVWGRTDPKRIDEMFGVFADEPMFDRMVERMQARRDRKQQAAEAEL